MHFSWENLLVKHVARTCAVLCHYRAGSWWSHTSSSDRRCRQTADIVVPALHVHLFTWSSQFSVPSCRRPNCRSVLLSSSHCCVVTISISLLLLYIFLARDAFTERIVALLLLMFVRLQSVCLWRACIVIIRCTLARISVYGWIVQCSGHPDTKACAHTPNRIFHSIPSFYFRQRGPYTEARRYKQ